MTAPMATRVLRADDAAIREAARCLASGGLAAFPTETVYGLGADATDGRAIARLYEAKGRPAFNPLIAHVADAGAARALARFDADAARLAGTFWPGALTLVLPKAAGCAVAELATAGLDTVAVRVPNHDVAQRLLARFGKPIVAPSANRSGHVSPIAAAASISSWTAARRGSASNPPSSPLSASRCCCVPAACRAMRSSARWGARSPIPPPARRTRRSRPECSPPMTRP